MNEPEVVRAMLEARTIAVVGLSDDPTKASYRVSAYMQRAGKKIVPVNPVLAEAGKTVLGERAVASLSEMSERPDVVNVFRLPKAIPGIVDEMLALGLTRLWVQLGIVHIEAARRAEQAGIAVVMDSCIMVEHARLGHDL